eukprot:gene13132-24060_t
MEDEHIGETAIDGHAGKSFFAVFDGHAGPTVSRIASEALLQHVLDAHTANGGDGSAAAIAAALHGGIFNLDTNMRNTVPQLRQGIDVSGSTCIAAFITPTHIIVANLGDSRAVLSSEKRVRFATADHKPTDVKERNRIMQAGGYVLMGRVCGNLAVSRALGDYDYKDRPDLSQDMQKVGAGADVTIIDRVAADDYLVLACDGIWDVISNEQCIDFVTRYHSAGHSLTKVAHKLLDTCLKKGSSDNMSVLIVRLDKGTAAAVATSSSGGSGAAGAGEGGGGGAGPDDEDFDVDEQFLDPGTNPSRKGLTRGQGSVRRPPPIRGSDEDQQAHGAPAHMNTVRDSPQQGSPTSAPIKVMSEV